MDDLATVRNDEAERHLELRFPIKRPVRRGLQRYQINLRRKWGAFDKIAVGPGYRRRVSRWRWILKGRKTVDVFKRLIGRQDYAADPLAKCRAHRRHVILRPNCNCLATPVNRIVTAGRGTNRFRQIGELFLEHLFEASVAGE